MSFDLKLVNGDLSLKNGDLEPITGGSKLIQDILKVCITKIGANPYSPWYGSLISRSIIGSVLEPGILTSAAQSQLQNALTVLQSLQAAQLEDQRSLSADEQLAAVTNISVAQSDLDPRLYEVRIEAITKAYRRIETSFTVAL